MRSVAGVALIAPARGRASKKIINIMHTGAARCFWKPRWPWVKTKPPKPAKPSTTGRAVCNARFLLREVHVSGALSGACTGKGPQIANPRPTPKPGNLGPPWPPGTGGNMSSACSVLPRDLVSVEVAAQQVGAHPQTLLTRSTFPVRYPVAHRKGPRCKPTLNAETWESRSSLTRSTFPVHYPLLAPESAPDGKPTPNA